MGSWSKCRKMVGPTVAQSSPPLPAPSGGTASDVTPHPPHMPGQVRQSPLDIGHPSLTAPLVVGEHLREPPLELQRDALTHHPDGVDGIHKCLRAGLEQITLAHGFDHGALRKNRSGWTRLDPPTQTRLFARHACTSSLATEMCDSTARLAKRRLRIPLARIDTTFAMSVM